MRKFLFAINCISYAVSALKSIMGLIMMINSCKQYQLSYKGH